MNKKYITSLLAVLLISQAQFAKSILTSSSKSSNPAQGVIKPTNTHIRLSPKDVKWPDRLIKEITRHKTSAGTTDTLFVDFKPGTYTLTQPIILNLKKENAAPVLISGLGKVIISAGKIVKNNSFREISDSQIKARIISLEGRNRVLEYDLKKNGVLDLGEIKSIGFGRPDETPPAQLFYNGSRMTLARYPNAGNPYLLKKRTTVIPINKVVDPGLEKVELPVEGVQASQKAYTGSFEYTEPRVEKWLNAKDVWLDGIFARDWAWSLNKVNKIDTVNKTISLLYKEKYDLQADGSFFFACNLLEEIDVPGEYYIDRATGKLYFYPPLDFNPKKSIIQLTDLPGDMIQLNGVSHVTFKQIAFQLGRGRAVNLEQCSDIAFFNCEFTNLGKGALAVKGNNLVIDHCEIHGIGGTAISLNGGDPETLTKSNNVVQHCQIYDWAYYNRVYTPAIALAGVGNRVIKNNLFDAPHGAITISGNDHLIVGNEIHDILYEFKDFGAIYGFLGANQLMRGQVIRGNYFHDIGLLDKHVHAVYADEGTAGWLVDHNLFYKIGNPGSQVIAVFGNTSSYMIVQNNIFLDCSETLEISFHFTTWGKKRYSDYFTKQWKEKYSKEGSISSVYLAHYPELGDFMKEERIYVNTNSFIGNTVGNFTNPLGHKNYFRTVSDLPNADYLVTARDNNFTTDTSLPAFLDEWNKSKDREVLKKSTPKILQDILNNLQ